jgi:hypothetical protein
LKEGEQKVMAVLSDLIVVPRIQQAVLLSLNAELRA